MDFERLPGGDLVGKGLADLARGEATDEVLLVSIAAGRLRAGGLSVPTPLEDAEHRLYASLARTDSDSAHSRYNALLRRLVSFESALECARWPTPNRLRRFFRALSRETDQATVVYLAEYSGA